MRTYRYLHLDVFTDRPFEGNQLAVFPEPQGLSTAEMQTITREMNFSECSFIFPAAGKADSRLRIFTPGEELPMAGHPTIGSTFALAAEGVIAPGRTDFVFALGVGPTPVSLEWNDGRLSFAWMTQPLPTFGATIEDRAALASAAGIALDQLAPGLPVQIVACGVPFLFVPVASRGAVDEVSIDRKAFSRCLRTGGIDEVPVFFFTTDAAGKSSGNETVYSRMLAPSFGIPEDPATGGASGPLGCYLLHHRLVSVGDAQAIVSLQGVAMGRPSRVHIAIDSQNGVISRVRVGGRAVMLGRGELHF